MKRTCVNIRNIKPFVTLDSSVIRDLFLGHNPGLKRLSLAEARVKPGRSTHRHIHTLSEEIYFVSEGKGTMLLGKKKFKIEAGDAIAILPKTPHFIINKGKCDLVIWCICSPPYEHSDTVLV